MILQQYKGADDLPKICERPSLNTKKVSSAVKTILTKIKAEGDQAVRAYSAKFDNVDIAEFVVGENELKAAEEEIAPELKKAIDKAAKNISAFHKTQIQQPIKLETMPGISCEQRAVPIERVGLYVPGGTAPLFSSVLMLAIPAVLAGCRKIVLTTPPDKTGSVPAAIRYAAYRSGLKTVYRVGGAQAIAAMAYGTETIPGVDKILGPGNQFVTAAKQLLAADGMAIDMPAGPSEVAIVADENANPQYVAADLLSQAEHGIDSQVLLVCTDEQLIGQIIIAVEQQLSVLPRQKMAKKVMEQSLALKVKNLEEAMTISNAYAPEHLILNVKNPRNLATKVVNAGSVFLGNLTPESLGDYASGTNHTLPTNMAARAYSGVNMDAFMKKITFQQLTPEGIQSIGKEVVTMAREEQLMAHANAMQFRIENFQNQ